MSSPETTSNKPKSSVNVPTFAPLLDRSGKAMHTIAAALRRRGLWLVFGAIGGIIGGATVAANAKPIVNPHFYYKSTAGLSLIGMTTTDQTSDPVRVNLQLAQFAAESDSYRKVVAVQTGTTPDYVKNHITVIPNFDTASLTVTAIDIDPDKTAQVAYHAGLALNDAINTLVDSRVKARQADIDIDIRKATTELTSLETLRDNADGDPPDELLSQIDGVQDRIQTLKTQRDLAQTNAPRFAITGMPQPVRINSKGYYLRWLLSRDDLGATRITSSWNDLASGTVDDTDTKNMIKVIANETEVNVVEKVPPVIHLGLGMIAGLMLGLSGIVLGEAWDERIHDTDGALRASGFLLLTEVPRLSGRAVRSLLQHGTQATHDRTRQAAYRYVEAASVLANQLGLSDAKKLTKTPVVLITSASPSEGKSTTSAAIAAAFAELGYRVLAVDGDYHRSSLRSNLRPIPNFVEPDAPLETSIDKINLLDDPRAKRHKGTATSTVAKLLRRIDRYRANYDVIVLDTPPILVTADASDFLHYADAVALVVRIEQTLTPSCELASTMIRHRNVPVTGLIATDVPLRIIDRNYGGGG